MGSSKRVEADTCIRNSKGEEMETMQMRKGKGAESMEGERERGGGGERECEKRDRGGRMQVLD